MKLENLNGKGLVALIIIVLAIANLMCSFVRGL